MALYEQYLDGEKVARAFTVDGSAEDAHYAAIAESGNFGWRRAKDQEGSGSPVSGPSAPVDSALFDPAEHLVEDVLAHLADADPEEQDRVLAAEEAGKARKSVLAAREALAARREQEE